ncbi:TadE/TadG family type IV pilus assembly protein [Nocardioides sp.]|uniref:TadE/TadG family type IV pilus assembly protein n=1 Tax=Nocardioides sp. TaxID=35761 RepID=UPI0039E2513F
MAIEAALVTPVVLLAIFGIIEMAFLLKDDVALTSLVRAGGRMASANAGLGPAGADASGLCASPCTPESAPMLAVTAAAAIQRAGAALPKESITKLWIYKANDLGYPGDDGNTDWSCSSNCVEYMWSDTAEVFGYVKGSWASTSIYACAGDPDRVGVYMEADHQFFTGLVGSKVPISDHAVFTFEPLAESICGTGGTAAGQHP